MTTYSHLFIHIGVALMELKPMASVLQNGGANYPVPTYVCLFIHIGQAVIGYKRMTSER